MPLPRTMSFPRLLPFTRGRRSKEEDHSYHWETPTNQNFACYTSTSQSTCHWLPRTDSINLNITTVHFTLYQMPRVGWKPSLPSSQIPKSNCTNQIKTWHQGEEHPPHLYIHWNQTPPNEVHNSAPFIIEQRNPSHLFVIENVYIAIPWMFEQWWWSCFPTIYYTNQLSKSDSRRWPATRLSVSNPFLIGK